MVVKKRKTKGTPDLTDVHVGQRLRVRRSLLGMSQESLGKAINITFQQIQKYERGTNRISAGRLYQFSKVLSVPISYFYEQFGEALAGQDTPAYGLSDNEQEGLLDTDLMQRKETIELVRSYYSIPDPKMRKEIQRFIKSMGGRMGPDAD